MEANTSCTVERLERDVANILRPLLDNCQRNGSVLVWRRAGHRNGGRQEQRMSNLRWTTLCAGRMAMCMPLKYADGVVDIATQHREKLFEE